MSAWQKTWALLCQRCPRCGRGRVYECGMRMNTRCPTCDLLFYREEGYFLGAMYISYGMATLILLVGLFSGHLLLPAWDLGTVVLLAGACFVPFVPVVTRYSRVIWIYFDRWAWPTRPGCSD